MHDKEHDSLKAGEDGEQVRHGNSALLKLETTKNPHGAQHAQLSHCSNGERLYFLQTVQVRVQTRELLSQLPHSDEKEENVHNDDDTDGGKETPNGFQV